MKEDKPMRDQTSLRNFAEVLFACRHAAREKGGGKGKKKREEENGVPSYDSKRKGSQL